LLFFSCHGRAFWLPDTAKANSDDIIPLRSEKLFGHYDSVSSLTIRIKA